MLSKKEPRSDVRATMVAALGRIRDREAIPVLADTLRNDLDKDVRVAGDRFAAAPLHSDRRLRDRFARFSIA